MNNYTFFCDCVRWPEERLEQLNCIIEHGRNITRRTFLKKVNREELFDFEQSAGYASHYKRGLTMAADWYVCYQKSHYIENGKKEIVYLLNHSCVTHVFKKEKKA